LIDEIENGLHYSVHQQVWQAIATAARHNNVQVFATTHSWECIRAAYQSFANGDQFDLAIHRLDRRDNEIQVVTYDREALAAAMQHEVEVR
jgi:AAA15 family ATPase/GTPase